MSELVTTRTFKPSLQRMMQSMTQDSSAQGKRWFSVAVQVLALGFIVWLFVSGSLPGLDGIAAGLGLAALAYFLLIRVMPRLVEKVPYNRSAFTRRRYQFSVDTLYMETSDGVTLQMPYRAFSRVVLRPEAILLYEAFPNFAAHTIPREVFESEEQEKTVRAWLAARTTDGQGDLTT